MRELLERLLTSGIFESGLHEDWEQYIKELLAKPESLTPREGLAEYKKGYQNGYGVAVRDLKQKVDSVFNLIMEEDDE